MTTVTVNISIQSSKNPPLARHLCQHSPPSNPAEPSAVVGSHHYLVTIEPDKDHILSKEDVDSSGHDNIKGGLVPLPVGECDQLISGPFCWWLRPSSDVQPPCQGSLEMPLSEPSLSACYWTGAPDGSTQRRNIRTDVSNKALTWHFYCIKTDWQPT